MLNNFIKTITKEAWTWLRPQKLLETICVATRLTAGHAAGAEGVLAPKYNATAVRDDYLCVTVPASNITAHSPVAGEDRVTPVTVSAELADDVYRYVISGLPEGLVALGKAPDAPLLLLYTDFVRKGSLYAFRENPASYGTITNQVNPVITFYCVGGPLQVKYQPQHKMKYNGTRDVSAAKVIDHVWQESGVCCGITGLVVNTVGENTPALNAGVIQRIWKEGDYIYAKTEKDLLYTRADSVLNKSVGDVVGVGDTIAVITTRNSNTGVVSVVLDNGDCDPSTQTLLSWYMVKCGGLQVLQRISEDLSTTLPVITLGLAETSLDTLYLFYSTDKEAQISHNFRGASAADILLNSATSGGICRIPLCNNSSGVYITGNTNKGSFIGKRMVTGMYIYGIGVGRQSTSVPTEYTADRIYKCKNISPVLVKALADITMEIVIV